MAYGRVNIGSGKSSGGSIYDLVIRTQEEFETMYNSPTWLDAVSVCFIGDGGTLKFTRSDGFGLKIPQTVKNIKGLNNAVIEVTDFAYSSSNKGGLWYSTLPATRNYSINDMEVNCTTSGMGLYDNGNGFYNCTQCSNCTGSGTGSTSGNGFYNCTQCSNCTGSGISPYGSGNGFYNCTQCSNCTGSGTGINIGYGLYNCHYLNGCKPSDTPSTTSFLGGANTKVDTLTVG